MTRRAIRLFRLTACGLALCLTTALATAHEGHGDDTAAEVMVIVGVVPGGPAAEAGLAEGDRILSWGGERLRSQDDLNAFLEARKTGDSVALEVERNGEAIALDLTLGDRGDGGPHLGISLAVEAFPQAAPATDDELTSDECRAWIGTTYGIGTLAAELGLDLDETIAYTSACVDGDLAKMPPSIPRGWCDNVFKVHCSGVDLLAEIGEALVNRCETQLSDSLGFDVAKDKTWSVCGEQKVFDAYSFEGKVSDAAGCRSIFIDECGAEIAGSGSR